MTIYDRLVEHVHDGGRYKIDLVNKTLRLGKEMVINEGQYEGELIGDLPRDPWEVLEDLYESYYNSCPSARTDRGSRYFKAKPVDEFDFLELLNGETRYEAQAKLEGFVLCAVLAGVLKWNPLYGTWFWRSPKHDDLRLLKIWF